ncbi:MAG: hypothetical protein M1819_006705 [Sarea resinae]|nr:MAG: hypothetical protein M1819_006705 [Sarea resinae]
MIPLRPASASPLRPCEARNAYNPIAALRCVLLQSLGGVQSQQRLLSSRPDALDEINATKKSDHDKPITAPRTKYSKLQHQIDRSGGIRWARRARHPNKLHPIHAHSLEATLEAHRYANRAVPIRRVPTDGSWEDEAWFKRPNLAYVQKTRDENPAHSAARAAGVNHPAEASDPKGPMHGGRKLNIRRIVGHSTAETPVLDNEKLAETRDASSSAPVQASIDAINGSNKKGQFIVWRRDPLGKREIVELGRNDKVTESGDHTTTTSTQSPKKQQSLKRQKRKTAQPMEVPPTGSEVSSTKTPWINDETKGVVDGLSRLQDEIFVFQSFVAVQEKEGEAREKLIRSITKLVADAVPDVSLQLRGPSATGLAFSTSGVEFYVDSLKEDGPQFGDRGASETRPQVIKEGRRAIHKIASVLHRSSEFRQLKSPRKETIKYDVPNLTILHISTNLRIIFTAGPNDLAALEYTKNYLVEYPALRPLYFVIYQLFAKRALVGPTMDGKFDSYTLFMMLVAAVKFSPHHPTEHNYVARQFLFFLDFYARFSTYRVGICIEPPHFFEKPTPAQKFTSEEATDKNHEAEEQPSNNAESPQTQTENQPFSPSPPPPPPPPPSNVPLSVLHGQAHFAKIARRDLGRESDYKARRHVYLTLQDPANHMRDLGRHITDMMRVRLMLARQRVFVINAVRSFDREAGVVATSEGEEHDGGTDGNGDGDANGQASGRPVSTILAQTDLQHQQHTGSTPRRIDSILVRAVGGDYTALTLAQRRTCQYLDVDDEDSHRSEEVD